MAAETERKAIEDLWPDHLPHLPPVTNKLGQPFTDAEHGIVCNCGDVLGWPEDAPVRTETVKAEVVEHHYDAAMDPSAMAGEDNPPAQGYAGPPRPGDGETYTDPSGIQWKSTPEHPHPDDPRFKYYGQADQPSPEEYSDDPADEAQAARYVDVQLPPVTDEQMARAGQALAEGDREGFHQALTSELPEHPPVSGGNLPARRADVVDAEDPIAARITIIDPSLPYGPADVEHQLLDIAARIERGVHFQRSWEERHYYAKVGFELASARALVNADGGDAATRKAQALLACEDEYLELAVCETMIKAIRETMHNLRSLQSGYQTVARSVGASMQNLPQRGA
jgi:hypothetical protein